MPSVAPDAIADVPEQWRLYAEDGIEVIFAPFGWINPQARIAIVGITPGWQQAQIAFAEIIERRKQGESLETAMPAAKRRASFAGTMRRNLVTMLDDLGVPGHLDCTTSAELFEDRFDLVHTTSALRYPVFKNGKNYSGASPRPEAHPVLREMLESYLVEELNGVPSALVVPLGKAVDGALQHLADAGLIDAGRCLQGFPHPSGANGHRRRIFDANREMLKQTVGAWFGSGRRKRPR